MDSASSAHLSLPHGLDADIGSLVRGELADLIVLDRNPLESVRNSTSIRYVMVNGRIFDAGMMAQIGNHPQPAPTFYWGRDPRSISR